MWKVTTDAEYNFVIIYLVCALVALSLLAPHCWQVLFKDLSKGKIRGNSAPFHFRAQGELAS